jgi:hypothetical protein
MGAARESGSHVFSIDQMNQRKKNRPTDQSNYQRMGEAPLGRTRRSWLEVIVVMHPPNAKLRYEWMEHLIPNNMGILRPDRVLEVGTVEDYMTSTGIWPYSLVDLRGGLQVVHSGSPSGNTMHSKGLVSLPYSPPFLPSDNGTPPTTIGLLRSDGLQGARPRVPQPAC